MYVLNSKRLENGLKPYRMNLASVLRECRAQTWNSRQRYARTRSLDTETAKGWQCKYAWGKVQKTSKQKGKGQSEKKRKRNAAQSLPHAIWIVCMQLNLHSCALIHRKEIKHNVQRKEQRNKRKEIAYIYKYI